MEILKIQNLNMTYHTGGKEIYAVRELDLNIEKKDSVGIVGESGSGKSTLAMGVLRLLSPEQCTVEGEILFQGQNLLALSQEELREIRWKKMAAVFQKSMNALSPVHRIGTQLEDIYRVHEPKCNKKERKKHILNLFQKVNLPESVYDSYPHELSGGMMQRVSIALSLILNPDFLVLDEATTALDVITQSQILDEIKQLQEEFHLSCMVITHDISVVSQLCRKVAVMYGGRIMEYGEAKAILQNPMHPYTKGLLDSLPRMHGGKEALKGIPGVPPDLSVKEEGCPFAARCLHALEACFTITPKMQKVTFAGTEREVSCYRVGGEMHGLGD